MAVNALLKFTQNAVTPGAGLAMSGATGLTVSVANINTTSIASWQIDLVYTPPGSSVAVATPLAFNNNSNTPAATFTPDVRGSYRLVLKLWSVINRVGTPDDTDIRVFSVPEARGLIVPPAQDFPAPLPSPASGLTGNKPNETNFAGQAFGWAGLGTDGLLANLIKRVDNVVDSFNIFVQPGVFNVKSYGAVGDGATNDTTAIASAIAAAAAAGGGVVRFPAGIYLTNAITMTANGVTLRGDGNKATIIKARQAGAIVTLSGCTGCFVEDIAIERADALFSSGGYSLVLTGCARCGGKDIRISYGSGGINVISSTRTHFRGTVLVEKLAAGGATGFLRYEGTAGAPSVDCSFEKLVYEHTYPVTATTFKGSWVAATVYATGDIVFNNDRFYQATTGGTSAGSGGPTTIPGTDGPTAYTTGITDNTVTWKFLIGNSFGINHDHDAHDLHIAHLECLGPLALGVQMSNNLVNAPSGLFIDRCHIEQTITHHIVLAAGSQIRIVPDLAVNYGGRGIDIQAATSSVEILGGKIDSCKDEGIAISSTTGRVEINGTEVRSCSQRAPSSASGIVTGAGVLNYQIKGVRSSGANQIYGLNIGSTNNNYVVENCDFSGNVTATYGLNDLSADTATSRNVRNNLGDRQDRAYSTATSNPAASIGATNAISPGVNAPKGMYIATIYVAVTTLGSAGTVTPSFNFVDRIGATSVSGSATSLTATNRTASHLRFWHAGGAPITWQTLAVAASGFPIYTIDITLERVSDNAN